MFKVTEAAEELGVTRQTVYNYIDRLGKKIDPYIYTLDGAKAIDPEGIKILRQAIHGKKTFTETGEQDRENLNGSNVNELLREHIDSLKEQIERLEKELDRREKDLDRRNQQFENFQVLLKQNQEKIQELEGEVEEVKEQEKVSIWQRLKWWGGNLRRE